MAVRCNTTRREPCCCQFGDHSGALPAIAQESPQAAEREEVAPQADATPAADAPEDVSPQVETSPPAPAAKSQNFATMDRLELESTAITGNRELPKVLYIVPWKKADIGDLPAQPFNTLIDEALTPVDRDVFRREVTYYGAVSSGGDKANPASAGPAAGPEK